MSQRIKQTVMNYPDTQGRKQRIYRLSNQTSSCYYRAIKARKGLQIILYYLGLEHHFCASSLSEAKKHACSFLHL